MIKNLFLWVIQDPSGQHSIMGFSDPNTGQMQAVTSKEDLANNLRPMAEEAAELLGFPIHLVKFDVTQAEIVTVIKPKEH